MIQNIYPHKLNNSYRPEAVARDNSLVVHFNKEGQTILLVTHDLRTAIRASRILYIEDGSIKGDLSLSPYKKDETKARETQVNAWLESLNW